MRSQVRGDGSQGSGTEIRFSASLDNDVTRSRGTRYAQFPSRSFFLPPNVFLTFYRVSLSSLKSGSLFIRAVKGRFICRRATRSRLSPLQIAASRGNLSAHLIGHRRGRGRESGTDRYLSQSAEFAGKLVYNVTSHFPGVL